VPLSYLCYSLKDNASSVMNINLYSFDNEKTVIKPYFQNRDIHYVDE